MRLLPLGQEHPSDFEDGEWLEKPGFPPSEGSWLRPTPGALPEFDFEEGHEKTRNEPPYRLTIGTHPDAQIRVDDARIPRRHCMVFKEGHHWYLESLSAVQAVWLGTVPLEQGLRARLQSGDVLSLLPPPTAFSYRILFDEADNWYLDPDATKDFPNKWPAKMPGHATESPPAPEELKRLAWETDQMRRRSEEDQVRVADWAAFSQYVKKKYHKYGIYAKPWRGDLGPPVPRPPPPGPRPYPAWVAELLATERIPPHVQGECPFKEGLRLSGAAPAAPLTPRAALPEGPTSAWGEAQADRFKSGGSGVMKGDPSVYEAAMELTKSSGIASEGLFSDAAGGQAPGAVVRSGAAWGAGATKAAAEVERGNATAAPGQPAIEDSPAGVSAAAALQVSFRDWLSSMEDAPFLLQYHDQVAAHFDSLSQVAELYFRPQQYDRPKGRMSEGGVPELDERFFEVVGITKLGHKRVLQKWFRDHCPRPGP